MKVLTIEEAQVHFARLCDEALAGEVIRLKLASGGLLQLTPVNPYLSSPALTVHQLTQSYEDPEWAEFENKCGKASD